jgi:simple sugar transport system permease protein|tara:strand:+ start:5687 stop:6655 length:969 start_codon:yes stop_codon:yes gene_type:complete
MKYTNSVKQFLEENASVFSILSFFIFMTLFFAISADSFFTQRNFLNLLRQSAPILIAATAMTFVITTGGIDLSVGSTLAIVNALCAILLMHQFHWILVLFILIIVGITCGLVQGYFIAYEGIPAFIVTLAGMSSIRGIALLMTEGFTIPIDRNLGIIYLGRGWLFGIPIPAIIAVVIIFIGYILLNNTTYGQYVTGIGSNSEATRRSGINIKFYTLVTYIFCGVCAAIGGIIIAARLGSGSSNAGIMFELEVIAAVVLGGTNLFGGKGSIVGTILGALTIAVIGNGLILLHVSPFYTQIVTGFIILIAIWLNRRYFQNSIKT